MNQCVNIIFKIISGSAEELPYQSSLFSKKIVYIFVVNEKGLLFLLAKYIVKTKEFLTWSHS